MASAVDDRHVAFVATRASRWLQRIQPLDLRGCQLNLVGGGVLLDARRGCRAS